MAFPKKTKTISSQWPLIRVLPRAKGRVAYQVDTRSIDGRQPKFKTLEEAQGHAEAIRREHQNSGLGGFSISTAQREDAKKALDLLRDVGLAKTRLEDIAEFYIRHNKPPAGEITLRDVADKFLENRRREGIKPVTLEGYASRLSQFCHAIGPARSVKDITDTEIEAYLHRPGISQQHARNDYAVLHSLFEFAKHPKEYRGRKTRRDAPVTGWIARNPTSTIPKPSVQDREPAVIDSQAAAALLRAAYETRQPPEAGRDPNKVGMLAKIVLELFAGVRPESEIPHLSWSDIEFHGKKASLNIRKSKNKAGIRNIDLPPVAIEWLRLCPAQDGPIHTQKNARRRWQRLKARAKITDWKQDCLRHTAASVHFRLHQDAAKTRAFLGHSISETGTLFAHYRALMTKEGAAKILNLTPARVLKAPDNIIPLPPAAEKRPAKSSPPRSVMAAR